MIRSEAGVRPRPHYTLYLAAGGREVRVPALPAGAGRHARRGRVREGRGRPRPRRHRRRLHQVTRQFKERARGSILLPCLTFVRKYQDHINIHPPIYMKHVQIFPLKYFRKPIRFLVDTLLIYLHILWQGGGEDAEVPLLCVRAA